MDGNVTHLNLQYEQKSVEITAISPTLILLVMMATQHLMMADLMTVSPLMMDTPVVVVTHHPIKLVSLYVVIALKHQMRNEIMEMGKFMTSL